jgi:hypothetical protein
LRSKDLLPGGWLNLPGRASHPLKYATLPGRTTSSSIIVNSGNNAKKNVTIQLKKKCS